MNKENFKTLLFVLLLCTTLGCEQVSTFFGYFSSEKQEAETQEIVEEKAAETQEELPEGVLAKVGSWTLTVVEFKERLEALKEVIPNYDIADINAKSAVLEELVRQQLLILDAEESGIDKEEDIKKAIDEFRRTVLVREVASGITEGLEVSESDARQYYTDNEEAFIEPVELKISEIVLNTRSGAKELLIQLLQGGDFKAIAKEKSIAKSAKKGGDLGFLQEMPFPEMVTAIANLEVGDVSSVFKGPEGHYIIKVTDKKGGKKKPFAELKEEIIKGLTMMKQQQAMLEYLNQLSQKFPVQVNNSLLE